MDQNDNQNQHNKQDYESLHSNHSLHSNNNIQINNTLEGHSQIINQPFQQNNLQKQQSYSQCEEFSFQGEKTQKSINNLHDSMRTDRSSNNYQSINNNNNSNSNNINKQYIQQNQQIQLPLQISKQYSQKPLQLINNENQQIMNKLNENDVHMVSNTPIQRQNQIIQNEGILEQQQQQLQMNQIYYETYNNSEMEINQDRKNGEIQSPNNNNNNIDKIKNDNENEQKNQQEYEEDEQDEELSEKCEYHKKSIIFICIDINCENKNKRACTKCISSKQIHSEHEVVDIEDSNQEFIQAFNAKKQNQSSLKNQGETVIEDFEQKVQYYMENFFQKAVQSKKLISEELRIILNDGKNNNQKKVQVSQKQNELLQELLENIENFDISKIKSKNMFNVAVKILQEYQQNNNNKDNENSNQNNQNQIAQKYQRDIHNYLLYIQQALSETENKINTFTSKIKSSLRGDFDININLELSHVQKIENTKDDSNIRLQQVQFPQNFNLSIQNLKNPQKHSYFWVFDNSLQLWDANQQLKIREIQTNCKVISILEFDDNIMIIGTQQGVIQKYKNCQYQMEKDLQNNQKPVQIEKIDHQKFITSAPGEYNNILIINLELEIMQRFSTSEDIVCYKSLALLSDPNYFVTASQKSRKIKLWNIRQQEKISELQTTYTSVGLTHIGNNKFILQDKNLIVYQVINFTEIQRIQIVQCHSNFIRALQYFQAPKIIITGSQDKSIIIWQFNDNNNTVTELKKLEYKHMIKNLLYVGETLISSSNDKNIVFWK